MCVPPVDGTLYFFSKKVKVFWVTRVQSCAIVTDDMLTSLETIARGAGELLLRHYGIATEQYTKSDQRDIVTDADVAVNAFVLGEIQRLHPEHGIVAEESGPIRPEAEYVWYVDPLDGTMNYLHGVPLFSVLIAVAHQGQLLHAAVYDPLHDQLALATRGQGATLNGQRIQCSTQLDWSASTGCLGARWNNERKKINARLFRSEQTIWVNAVGSSGISALYVATGRRDWMFSLGSRVWDYAAPVLLLEEAGCTVTTLEGDPWTPAATSVVASNAVLHKELLRTLQ
jgi:myo-inositol-1(or 4)-monophosphatase